MIIRQPDFNDISEIIRLNSKYFFAEPTDDQKQKGYLGKKYSMNELQQIIADKEIVIAKHNDSLAGYYLLGFKNDIDASVYKRNRVLKLIDINGIPLTDIAYPTQVCIDEEYRGNGLFGKMLSALIGSVKDKYKKIYCSISEDNIVSVKAHLRNGWELVNSFEARKFFVYK